MRIFGSRIILFHNYLDHLTLSFNTALRQMIIKKNPQTLNTAIAVQRRNLGGFAKEAEEHEAHFAPHPELISLSAWKTTDK